MHPLRTMMFAPGSDHRKISKAIEGEADAVILDLEDAVAVSEKARAREMIAEALRFPRKGSLYIRVNSVNTEFFYADMMSVMVRGLNGVVLPKCESAEEVRRVDWLMGLLEQERGLPSGSVELVPLVESAAGIQNSYAIAAATTRVKRLIFGAIDFTLDIGTNLSKQGREIFYARCQLVVSSRAAGIMPPIDTVFPDVRDAEGWEADCREARQLGFQGKLVIHPSQVEIANRVFSPTPDEVAYAYKVVQAFSEAESQGMAAIQVEGKFVDYPVVKRARDILALDEAINGKEAVV